MCIDFAAQGSILARNFSSPAERRLQSPWSMVPRTCNFFFVCRYASLDWVFHRFLIGKPKLQISNSICSSQNVAGSETILVFPSLQGCLSRKRFRGPINSNRKVSGGFLSCFMIVWMYWEPLVHANHRSGPDLMILLDTLDSAAKQERVCRTRIVVSRIRVFPVTKICY